jgi:hypothetical protein
MRVNFVVRRARRSGWSCEAELMFEADAGPLAG